MNFREWQARYNPVLDDILVRQTNRMLDRSRARDVALRMWDNLVSQEKLGYGVFKVRDADQAR